MSKDIVEKMVGKVVLVVRTSIEAIMSLRKVISKRQKSVKGDVTFGKKKLRVV